MNRRLAALPVSTRRRSPIATPTSRHFSRQFHQIKRRLNMKSRILGLFVAGLALGASTAFAADIALDGPWSRATPGGAQVAGGFMTIRNAGSVADRLVSGKADVAGRVEIHEMTMVDGVMKMRPITGLEVPAGKAVELKPGGYHVMFLDLKQPLKAGDTIKGSLTFEKAGTIALEYKVEPMGATGAGAGGHSKH
jgi:periplasmic copper chaperone A